MSSKATRETCPFPARTPSAPQTPPGPMTPARGTLWRNLRTGRVATVLGYEGLFHDIVNYRFGAGPLAHMDVRRFVIRFVPAPRRVSPTNRFPPA
jgi:hypothetical protein